MSYHILIAESDPRLRVLLCEMLKEEFPEAQVEAVGSSSKVLLAMYHKPIDLVVADWHMPKIDGMTLVERVRSLRPKAHVILLTPADSKEIQERRRKRKLSFTAFTNPFPVETFLEYIHQVLERSRMTVPRRHSAQSDDERRFRPALKPALGLR